MAKIVQVPARAVVAYGLNPAARLLLRLGVSPNAVTIAGTVGVLIGAYAAVRESTISDLHGCDCWVSYHKVNSRRCCRAVPSALAAGQLLAQGGERLVGG